MFSKIRDVLHPGNYLDLSHNVITDLLGNTLTIKQKTKQKKKTKKNKQAISARERQ